MAFLSGIGRAFTSIGTDMRRNRLERDERERFFADRKNQQDYAAEIRTQQAGIRAAETQANRDWSRRQQEAQNLYTEGVTQANRDWTVGEFDRQAVVRADAAEAAGDRARDVVTEGRTYAESQFQEGVDAANRIAETLPTGSRPAGQRKPIPYPDEPWPAAIPGDRALMQRERLTFPATVGPSATEAAAVRRNVASAGEIVHPEEGWVTGYQWNPFEIEQRSRAILQGRDPGGWNQGVPEPTFESEMIKTPGFGGSMKRLLPGGDPGWEMSAPPVAAIDAGGEQVPPGIDPDEYRRMLDDGATPAEIQKWVARRARRGGRFR